MRRMETVTIRPCTVADFENAPNIAALLAEYSAESAIEGLGQPKADFDQYKQLEAAQVLYLFGAYQADVLVGFLVMIVSGLPHYDGARIASTESYFVMAEARKSGAGLKLLHKAERIAQSLGAVGFFVVAPVGSRLASVLDGIGYRTTNHVFFRSLS